MNLIVFCLVTVYAVLNISLVSEATPLVNHESRIVNGHLAEKYQFPWHVSIQAVFSNNHPTRFCGGSLIKNDYVLTLATCIAGSTNVTLGFGSNRFYQPNETVISTEYTTHPGFSTVDNANDIAVIRLSKNLTNSNLIRPVMLPTLSQVNDQFVNNETHVSGFGVASSGKNDLSNELRFANTVVITTDSCGSSFNSSLLRASTLCSIGSRNSTESACFGDEGGALVMDQGFGKITQIGIISLIHPGDNCTGRYPFINTRITSYLQWIANQTGLLLEV